DPSPYMQKLTAGVVPNATSFTVWSGMLHMHTRGANGKVWIERAGGASDCVVDIPAWSFHWQGSYTLAQPKTFNPGDQLGITCHFANDSDSALNWGEGTADEM